MSDPIICPHCGRVALARLSMSGHCEACVDEARTGTMVLARLRAHVCDTAMAAHGDRGDAERDAHHEACEAYSRHLETLRP